MIANVTDIIIPISPTTAEDFRAATERAQAARADLVELRLDTALAQGADGTALFALIPEVPLPVVVTIRHQAEGGDWSGSEDDRRAYLQQADKAGAAFIDYELRFLDQMAWKPASAKLILSYHNFSGPGTDLEQRIEAMYAAGADIAKVAITASDAADLAPLAALCQDHAEKSIITIAMGDHGAPSRLLAGAWGCSHTFARLDDGDEGSAPGQPTISQLLDAYQLKSQDTETLIFGVLGNPVGHSLSPAIHNSAFVNDGVNAVYVPFLATDAVAFWTACKGWIDGLSITIPHKHALYDLTDRNEDLAMQIGAINTIYRDEQGQIVGANTDAQAALECVAAVHGDVAGSRCLVLGAGGVSRALCYALHDAGAQITLTNRNPERAEQLAQELGISHCAWDAANEVEYDVLINATSVGMNQDASPWPSEAHRGGTCIFDTVYTPLETTLLKDGAMAGCRCQDGLRMFIRQAAGQYQRWLDCTAPDLIMRRVALERLGFEENGDHS